MTMIDEIRIKIRTRQYEFSKHAVDQSIIRDISVAEMEEAIGSRSEIIEDYPEDNIWPEFSHPWLHKNGPAIARSVQLSKQATR